MGLLKKTIGTIALIYATNAALNIACAARENAREDYLLGQLPAVRVMVGSRDYLWKAKMDLSEYSHWDPVLWRDTSCKAVLDVMAKDVAPAWRDQPERPCKWLSTLKQHDAHKVNTAYAEALRDATTAWKTAEKEVDAAIENDPALKRLVDDQDKYLHRIFNPFYNVGK